VVLFVDHPECDLASAIAATSYLAALRCRRPTAAGTAEFRAFAIFKRQGAWWTREAAECPTDVPKGWGARRTAGMCELVLGYEARTSNVGWTNGRIKLMQLSFQILIDE
jgi:hypothetical protein